ncbi:uncharacterized protein EAF01_002397 [Botrytis porri]|uniref:uncharacterized protein n=1 Tax=Botrytis porri TaxID=87229 RepID=UPI0019022AFC|nr:uncharacterized protein EAF01_002397 [Botrytis porri]KAF7910888.1 hypothetical protein EAF01_002397 [Botrytis porri]
MVWKYALIDCDSRTVIIRPANMCEALSWLPHQEPKTIQRQSTLRFSSSATTFRSPLVGPIYVGPSKDTLAAKDMKG